MLDSKHLDKANAEKHTMSVDCGEAGHDDGRCGTSECLPMTSYEQHQGRLARSLSVNDSDLASLRKAAARGKFLIEALCNPDSGDLAAIAKAMHEDGPDVPDIGEFEAAIDAAIVSKTQTKEPL